MTTRTDRLLHGGGPVGSARVAAAAVTTGSAAKDRGLVHLAYLWRHRRWLDLNEPRRFTELVQWRKLHDRDPRLPRLIDKVTVKEFVRDRIGAAWITPTLWHGATLPDRPDWLAPFVIKSRHGCNQRLFVRTAQPNWSAIQRISERWLVRSYGGWLAEWGYRDVPRGLLAEPFIGPGQALPIDYKLYVFGGRVAAVQVHLDREGDHRWVLLDRYWRVLSRQAEAPPRPRALAAMIEAAETLGSGFDFVRIDLYDALPHPRFGEMSFYPGSGLDPFDREGLDHWLGDLWQRASAASLFGRGTTAASIGKRATCPHAGENDQGTISVGRVEGDDVAEPDAINIAATSRASITAKPISSGNHS